MDQIDEMPLSSGRFGGKRQIRRWIWPCR